MELEELAERDDVRTDWVRIEDPYDAETAHSEWVDAYEL